MAKQSLFKKVRGSYKKHPRWWLGGAVGLAFVLAMMVGFMLAGKAATDYSKAYESWQKNTAARFVAKTSPDVNLAAFPTDIDTQKDADAQKKACSELKAAVEVIDKRTDQPPRLGFVLFGFLNPSYSKAKATDKQRQASLEDYLKTARRVYDQARADCEFKHRFNVTYLEFKPKFDQLDKMVLSYGESRNGLTCWTSHCVPTTSEELATFLDVYSQSHVAMMEKYLSYWRSPECRATSYREMCDKEAERARIVHEAKRGYVEDVKGVSGPTDSRIAQARDKATSEYGRGNKLRREAAVNLYGNAYDKELENNDSIVELVMLNALKKGFAESRAKAAAFK